MLMFLLVALLYYFQEYTRLSKELVLNAHLEYIECMKLELGGCIASPKGMEPNMHTVYLRIFSVFGLLLLLFIPISLYLSFFSVRPVRKASKMIDSFIEHIVHDINTPISTIMLNIKSLIKQAQEPSGKLTRILASTEQLSDMQHDLLALSDEKITQKRELVALKPLIEEIMADFRLTYPAQPFVLLLSEWDIYANRIDLRRIIQNLISNAVKYNRNAYPITLTTKKGILILEDQGKGIKDPEKIFDTHYREDYTIQGSGIGLASVMAMLTRNHIEIKVSSQIDQGTTIQLHFEDNPMKDQS